MRSLTKTASLPSTEQPRLLGDDLSVTCLDGQTRRYVDADKAASTPPLRCVHEAMDHFLPWYSSVHRGGGAKSRLATAAFEGARQAVAEFIGARNDDVIIFVKNTTEAINLFSMALNAGTRVLSTPMEHHANMLPWRRHAVELLPFVDSPEQLLAETEAALARAKGEIKLLAVTGASNVTGDIYPIAELAQLAHCAGAEIFVDGAQLTPHRAVNLEALDIDYLAFSGHKMYAPYGVGALVGRCSLLEQAPPLLRGGGAAANVTLEDVRWAHGPGRCEGGSPNVVGAVALGVACDTLSKFGMHSLQADEDQLSEQLLERLAGIDGVHVLQTWPEDCQRLAIASFVVDGYDDRLVMTVLGLEFGIAVRNGRFCAHPFVAHLLERHNQCRSQTQQKDLQATGAVRVSFGLGNTAEDIDRLEVALTELISKGPNSEYRFDAQANRWHPIGLTEPALPNLPFRLS